jgi:hypothetical protein
MKIKAIPVRAEDLKPGELFSTAGPEYWDSIDDRESLGERAYIRTNTPCPADQKFVMVSRLEIEEE